MILRNKGYSDAVQDLLAGAVCSPGMAFLRIIFRFCAINMFFLLYP